MDWTKQLDNYCERTDFAFWSEPVNAITNAAFLIAAFVVWVLIRKRIDLATGLLLVTLVAIGTGSFLFHTLATRWALMADVLPILIFILLYLHFATTRLLEQPVWTGWIAVIGFFPFSWGMGFVITEAVGGLNGSVGYIPVAMLIALYGLLLLRRDRPTALGLFAGAAILSLSLFFRTIDDSVCASFPLGTHFLWHTLNGIMLGWMIWVMDQHRQRRAR